MRGSWIHQTLTDNLVTQKLTCSINRPPTELRCDMHFQCLHELPLIHSFLIACLLRKRHGKYMPMS